ncbi:helix-turn-helix transcriptional regulator [Mycolicibacter minnesotensis]
MTRGNGVRDALIASGAFPELLTAEHVSALLGVSTATLNRWASVRETTGQQVGPPCYTLSDRVRRWDSTEVCKWLKGLQR